MDQTKSVRLAPAWILAKGKAVMLMKSAYLVNARNQAVKMTLQRNVRLAKDATRAMAAKL